MRVGGDVHGQRKTGTMVRDRIGGGTLSVWEEETTQPEWEEDNRKGEGGERERRRERERRKRKEKNKKISGTHG